MCSDILCFDAYSHCCTPTAKKVSEAPAGPSSKPLAVSTSSTIGSIKKKQPEKASAISNGEVDGVGVDGEGSVLEEDDHELPPRLNKRRRISKESKGPSRSELQKAVSRLDASVRRVQESVTREVDKMNGIIKSLNVMITEMESD